MTCETPVLIETPRSDCAWTGVVNDEELLDELRSVVGDETFSVSLRLVALRLEGTFPVNVKLAEAPVGKAAILPLTLPPRPTNSGTRLNAGPLVCVRDWNVMPGGSASVKLTFCASEGPLLVTFSV